MLIPVPSALWKPPLMHYGWPAPRQRLLEYAERHGLIKLMSRRNPKDPDESDSESDFSTDDEIEDDEDEPASNSSQAGESQHSPDGSGTVILAMTTRARKPCPPVPPPDAPPDKAESAVDQISTMFAALIHIYKLLNENPGTQFGLPLLQITPTLQDGEGECQIVSLYTNYNFLRKDLPLPEHIEAFGEAFGVETPPRWFLDEEQHEWWSVNYPRRR
ncbi:uncharacterized protein C8Q71DRAFT_769182 [Rhodofomes roseus]|uniref:Uncharacterized protein n=1 Tax=Rhodofomes roseus TaxID=34475 RepID=A0ABQ8KAI0_9APHY|nr:uncharacterized protein C8Q71DRAFT_769182 [Rhodofomes roseus]KAH9834495.1 hypothetical protein C8Q71DRAFT_769182 [Rhodofomes roseus]